MAKKVRAFPRAEIPNNATDPAQETRNGMLGRLAQMRLEFAEGQFDRVEVRRIFGQIDQRRSRRLDRLRDAGDFVGCKVIHEDDVTAVECRGQTSFNIGAEDLSIERAFDHEGCHDSVMAQAGYQRDRLPMPMRNKADQPLTAGSAAPQPYHIGAGGRFIDEHQPGRVKQKLLSPPAATCVGDVRPLLLRGAQALFF